MFTSPFIRFDAGTLIGLRDRALIALMGYTFARGGAAVAMKVEDYYIHKRRGSVRLHVKRRQGDRAPLPPQPGTVFR